MFQSIDITMFLAGTSVASLRGRLGHSVHGRGAQMNWDRIQGNWKQLTGKVKEQWGKLTDDQIDKIAGQRDQLAGKLQESYGITKDEAERQITSFEDRYGEHDAAM